MAGLAGLILREVAMQAVRRMAPAAGAAIVAGTANEIRKKQEEADKAKDTPLARTAAQAKADECAKGAKKCEECPADKGVSWQRNFKERRVWVDYQARMCGMPNGPNFIMEWIFNTVTFDGFDSSQCHLTEAKAAYDQFFNRFGGFEYPFQKEIFDEMFEEAFKQNIAAKPMPPIRLTWYFMEPVSFRYMQPVLQAATPQIEVLFRP